MVATLAEVYVRQVVKLHNIPKNIVSCNTPRILVIIIININCIFLTILLIRGILVILQIREFYNESGTIA